MVPNLQVRKAFVLFTFLEKKSLIGDLVSFFSDVLCLSSKSKKKIKEGKKREKKERKKEKKKT